MSLAPAIYSFIFLLQVGGRRSCGISLLRESPVEHVNSAHDIRGQGKSILVTSATRLKMSLKSTSATPLAYWPAYVPLILAKTLEYLTNSHDACSQSCHSDYLPNKWIFFNSFSLKIFSAMLVFQMVSVKRQIFVLFVRSLTTVLAIIESLLFIHVTSDWVSLKTK